ncbi:MAG: cobalamin-dependent protein, partial [Candidatus Hydrogenedentes bacterium]|nr:cobalamin-dependent protein [Candidatus Hydrogenedentota bacterium]
MDEDLKAPAPKETAVHGADYADDVASLDCLLVHVPKFQTFYPPLNVYQSCNRMAMGLMVLADLADRNGYQTKVLHVGIERALKKCFSFGEYLEQHRPKAIGFSLMFHHSIVDTLRLTAEARRVLPEAFIFFGGFTATFFAREIMETVPGVDAIIMGDSTEPFLKMLKNVLGENSGDLSGIPNLIWRKDASTVENPQSFMMTEKVIDDLVYTRFDLLEHARMYLGMSKAVIRTNLPNALNLRLNRILGAERSSIFWGLPVGLGCVSNCFYCGGGAGAQWQINKRRGVVFRAP